MKTTLQPHADKLVKFLAAAEKSPFVRLARNAAGGIILDGKGMPLVEIFAEAAVKEIVEGENSVVHFISTPRIDPVKDVMNPFGANTRRLDKNRSVFYNHRWSGAQDLPIGKNLWTKPVRDGLLAKTQYAVDERTDGFAKCIFKMVQGGFLNSYSIGFFPSSYSFVAVSDLLKLVDGAFDIPNAGEYSADEQVCYHKDWNMYEYSQVGVPMNEDAVRKTAEKGLAIAEEIGSEYGVDFFGKLNGGRQKVSLLRQMSEADPAGIGIRSSQKIFSFEKVLESQNDQPLRWNKTLSPAFDVAREHLQASALEYDWASRYIGCQIKDVYQNSDRTPASKMGSWLTGLREVLSAGAKIEDTRRITYDGKEEPPVYETIQLNSKKRDDFMIDGILFCAFGEDRAVIKLEPEWYGLRTTVYTSRAKAELNNRIFDEIAESARLHNFLKGEAFSVSGQFLERGEIKWDDVFLEPKNEKALRTAIDLLNKRGASMAPRGQILMGPPGTGKTLSGRAMMTEAKSTFVWISSRDFYYMGAFRGIAHAFDLAKENAPAILFFEDVDNWLGGTETDLLKTEMDGISRKLGIVTVLTTNYPERLPDALIDRPGRFHDVLELSLPTPEIRKKMLERWIPGLDAKDLELAVRETEGDSGAHVYELAYYARTLADEEGASLGDALAKAIKKIREQRELIDRIQLSGSNYRPRKELSTSSTRAVTKTLGEVEAEVVPDEVEGEEKGVIRFAHHPLAPVGTAWSAGAEVKKADVKALKVMCTWFADPGEKKGDYKLPHHKGDGDHPTVWNGVKAAMGALLGARGGVQIPTSTKSGCHAHLASHYKEFEKPVPEMKEYSEEELKAMFPENYETKQVEPGEEDVSARFDDVDSELAALSQAVAGLTEAVNGLNAKLDQAVSMLETIAEEEQGEPSGEGAGQAGSHKTKLKGAAESSGAQAPAQTDLAELRRQAIAGELSRKTGRS